MCSRQRRQLVAPEDKAGRQEVVAREEDASRPEVVASEDEASRPDVLGPANGRKKTLPCSACCCGIGEKGRNKHGQRVSMERGIVTKKIKQQNSPSTPAAPDGPR